MAPPACHPLRARKLRGTLFLIALLPLFVPSAHAGKTAHAVDEGGPDAWGNTWTMTGDEGGPEYEWNPLFGNILNFEQGVYGPFYLEGALSLYGLSYSTAWLTRNGLLCFYPPEDWSGSSPLPNPDDPGLKLAYLWHEDHPTNLAWINMNAEPELQRMTIQTTHVLDTFLHGWVRSQIVLDFANQQITIHYQDQDEVGLQGFQVGLQNATGETGLTVFSGESMPEQTSVRFDLLPAAHGVALFPPLQGTITTSNQEVEHSLLLTCGSQQAEDFALSFLEDLLDWQVLVGGDAVSQTGLLQPQQRLELVLRTQVLDLQEAHVDQAVFEVSSEVDPEASMSIPLLTEIIPLRSGGPDSFGNRWWSSETDSLDASWIILPAAQRIFPDFDWGETDRLPLPEPLYLNGRYHEFFAIHQSGELRFFADTGSTEPERLRFYGFDGTLSHRFWYYGIDPGTGHLVVTIDRQGVGARAQAVIDLDERTLTCQYTNVPVDERPEIEVSLRHAEELDSLVVLMEGIPTGLPPEWSLRFGLGPAPLHLVHLPEEVEGFADAGGVTTLPFTIQNRGTGLDRFTFLIEGVDPVVSWNVVDSLGTEVSHSAFLEHWQTQRLFLRCEAPLADSSWSDEFVLEAHSQFDPAVEGSLPCAISVLASHGVDAWGNRWYGGNHPEGTPASWIELPEESRIALDFVEHDTVLGPVDLPGELAFYGQNRSQIWIRAQGRVGFDPAQMGDGNAESFMFVEPNLPNEQIYALSKRWFNLDSLQAWYGFTTDNRLVISWERLAQSTSDAEQQAFDNAQLVIDTATDEVWIHHGGLNTESWSFRELAVGMEDQGGDTGLVMRRANHPFWLLPGRSYRIQLVEAEYFFRLWAERYQEEVIAGQSVLAEVVLWNRGTQADRYPVETRSQSWFDAVVRHNDEVIERTPWVEPGDSLILQMETSLPTGLGFSVVRPVFVMHSEARPTLADSTEVFHDIRWVEGGPDSFGNGWITEESDPAAVFEWADPEGFQPVVFPEEGLAGPLPLGSPFLYYGESHEEIYLSRLGWVCFQPDCPELPFWQISVPTPDGPNGFFSGCMAEHTLPDSSQVLYRMEPEGLLLEFRNWSRYGYQDLLKLQLRMHAPDASLRFSYLLLDEESDAAPVRAFIESPDGSEGLVIGLYGQHVVRDSSALWFGPHVLEEVSVPEKRHRPAAFALHSPAPNPFNPSTRVTFQLAQAGPVRLEVYNLLGARVASLVDEVLPAGEHALRFEAGELASGVYFLQLQQEGRVDTRKMLLLR